MSEQTEVEIKYEEATSTWDEVGYLLESPDFRDTNIALCYISERITPELLEENPLGYIEGLEIALQSLGHENYTVQAVGVDILGKIVDQNKGSTEHFELLNPALEALENVAEDENDRYRKVIRVMAKDRIPNLIEKV